MSSMQEEEIAIERGKEYFEDLRKHFKNIQKIMNEEDLAELSRPEAQKLLAQNIIKHQTYVNNFLEQNLIMALSASKANNGDTEVIKMSQNHDQNQNQNQPFNPQDAKPIKEEEKKDSY